MKRLVIIISIVCFGFAARCQNLTVEGTAPNLYITHTVAPKENFYSVGRLYNQTPKAIAAFNNLVMEKGLAIGQRIKIPLNTQNLDEKGNSTSGETLIPLTHIVGKNETISKIAADHSVSSQSIKQWNNISSDNITPGTPLVVGHLKMSSAGVAKINANQQEINKPLAKQEAVAKQVAPQPKQEETASAPQQQPVIQTETSPANTATPAPAKETSPKQEVLKQAPAKETIAKQDEPAKAQTFSYTSTATTGSVEGVFANAFTENAAQKSLNTKSGDAATFKSTSGWQDKKYYVLMNEVTPGTILKISSSENKVVYAKVLGSMPEMKENNGLLMRISNAAASYLGIIDPKFPVQISYYQ